MIEQKFKVLMVNGEYVDETLLGKGIYYTNKPTLLNKDMTIKSLVQSRMRIKDFVGEVMLPEEYFINLRLCELVDVTLILSK